MGKDYIDYMIENKAAASRAKSIQKKNVLIKKIKDELGLSASKSLSMKKLNNYFD